MKVAIPQWRDRVSPVFDVARTVVLFDIADGRELGHKVVSLSADDLFQRAEQLHRLGAQVLICGAISRSLETALVSTGILVVPYICGPVEVVLHAFLDDRLQDEAYLMPGCDHGGRRQGGVGPTGGDSF